MPIEDNPDIKCQVLETEKYAGAKVDNHYNLVSSSKQGAKASDNLIAAQLTTARKGENIVRLGNNVLAPYLWCNFYLHKVV